MESLAEQGADINVKDKAGVSKTTLLDEGSTADLAFEVVAHPPETFLLGV